MLNEKSKLICSKLAELFLKTDSKGVSSNDVINVISDFKENWRTSYRSKQAAAYRYIRILREFGVVIDTINGRFFLNKEKSTFSNEWDTPTKIKMFKALGEKLIPEFVPFTIPLESDILDRISNGLFIFNNTNKDSFQIVLRAWISKKCLLVNYTFINNKKGKEEKSFVIEPHGLILWDSEWVVLAKSVDSIDYLKVNNISSVYEVEKTFEFDQQVTDTAIELLFKED